MLPSTHAAGRGRSGSRPMTRTSMSRPSPVLPILVTCTHSGCAAAQPLSVRSISSQRTYPSRKPMAVALAFHAREDLRREGLGQTRRERVIAELGERDAAGDHRRDTEDEALVNRVAEDRAA